MIPKITGLIALVVAAAPVAFLLSPFGQDVLVAFQKQRFEGARSYALSRLGFNVPPCTCCAQPPPLPMPGPAAGQEH